MAAVNVFRDCAQRIEKVEETFEYGQTIDARSAMARDDDGRPVSVTVEPLASLQGMRGRDCTVEAGETSSQGKCTEISPDSVTLVQEGRATVIRGYDGVYEDEGRQSGTVRVSEPCTLSFITKDISWECVCDVCISDSRCTLAYSALIRNDSGGDIDAQVCCVAAEMDGALATEDVAGYSLGTRHLPTLSVHLLFTAATEMARHYCYTIGSCAVRTCYVGQAPEFLPEAWGQVYRDGRVVGRMRMREARAGEQLRLEMGTSDMVVVEETCKKEGDYTLKMSNRGTAEALVEVYLEGAWTDVLPLGHHDEGDRFRWMVLLPSRSTKTLSCKGKKVI